MDISDIVKSGELVRIPQFQNPSMFSKTLRKILRAIIIPLSDEENREEYRRQFDTASRNLEIAVEGLIKLFARHPAKGMYAMRGVVDWFSDYFRAQKEAEGKERYFVYTQHDRRVPFRPEEDVMYVYMIAQLAFVINEAADIVSRRELGHIVGTFQDANDVAVDVFKRHPTTMPRFRSHKRISLRAVQGLDKPVNCCPSLHIGYSMLLDNVARTVIAPWRREAFDAIRYSTLRMFNSVLYTAQHSIIDVAFGMVCAKRVFEQRFNARYQDLTETFAEMQEQHPAIGYGEIRRIYEEGSAAQGSLADVIGGYLAANGYPKVRADEDVNDCYFDTERREMIRKDAGARI